MATQTVAFPDDHQGAGNLDLVRQSSHAIAERLQPRAKLRTCTLPSEHPDNELNDSQRIIRICAAMNVVLEFIRTAKLRDSELLISDGTEHIEARATLQSAVEELELLREQLKQLDKDNLALRDEVDRVPMFEEIVGASPALQTVLSNIVKVAPTDSTVLITGETGTGKELIARAIHKHSQRSCQAFIWVSAGSSPTSSRKIVPECAISKRALAALHRAGEGAFLVAKQLRRDQGGRNRRTVYADVRRTSASGWTEKKIKGATN
jgi:hypothetical protein